MTTPDAYPYARHLSEISISDPASLLAQMDDAIKTRDQARACAIAEKYTSLNLPARALLDKCIGYAVSEEGALHGEKYFRTVAEEYATTRSAYRSRQLIALARVTASEYGFPAPGYQEARELLKA